MSKREKYKKLDWAKFSNFESRRSVEDLNELCDGKSRSQLAQVFTTRDAVGLYPIHWAAIHNRSDFIEFMVDRGSPLKAKCKNKLFADGTALHLAAMNGSIEAASMLLYKCVDIQTEPKLIDTNEANQSDNKSFQNGRAAQISWLRERDADGQTPLMKSAPPRTKRLNTIRDLLRKNLWSLSGRPAEMALFLICKGADWRETDSISGLNLMHWAIVNDYDDIVNLLLVIDKEIINIPAKISDAKSIKAKRSELRKEEKKNFVEGFESIKLSDSSSATSDVELGERGKSQSKSLISPEEKSKKILAEGLMPLQLAIIYGRVGVISLLWHAKTNEKLASPSELTKDSPEFQRDLTKKRADSRDELKQIVSRAFWSNKEELARFTKRLSLKFILALDLAILAVLWIPNYATTDDEGSIFYSLRGGMFIFSYCISMALAFRVILKNPGFLRRSSLQYLRELKSLIEQRQQDLSKTELPFNTEGEKTSSSESSKTKEVPSIKSEDKPKEGSAKALEAEVQPPTSETRQKVSVKSDNQAKEEIITISKRWEHKTDLEDRVRIFCHKCHCIRRPRSRHCNYCNHCIQDFDHHCIYLGCCIGRYNRIDFLLTMIVLTITSLYGTVLHATSLERSEWSLAWHYLGLIWIFKYVLIGGLTAFCILKRACLGVTMYEAIRSARIRKIFGPSGPPERISKSHHHYSTLKRSFWRYMPDRFLTGDLPARTISYNLKEFFNFTSMGEYLLTTVCPDSPLTRSLASSDSRLNLYKFV